MLRLFSNPRFLAVYSGVLTLAFIATVVFALSRGDLSPRRVRAAEQLSSQSLSSQTYDQITVHRINVVEPDGTPRLIISDKAEFPGEFFRGKEMSRPDRSQSAGMLFMNDEGTENGGLIFDGYQSPDGKFHSHGHLSFDEYEQDQTLALETSQDGDDRESGYQINDNGPALFTPDLYAALQKLRAMPDGPEKDKARAEFAAKYPISLSPRARLMRLADKSCQFRLYDSEGRTRIMLRVDADGTPSMQFLDAGGKVTQEWPEAITPSK
jgi:hypothetical protein